MFHVSLPNDPSSATAATRRADCNRDSPPPFAAAHGGVLIPAPLVIISGGWFITQCETVTPAGVPIDFDVTDMAIHETNHIHCVIKLSRFTDGWLPRMMPRVGKERRI